MNHVDTYGKCWIIGKIDWKDVICDRNGKTVGRNRSRKNGGSGRQG
jgi:hypothetical protein